MSYYNSGDEETALGNSHPRTTSSPKPVDGTNRAPVIDGSGPVTTTERSQPEEESSERKEKSVLQAKLTKLAIQIGYAGMCASVPIVLRVRNTSTSVLYCVSLCRLYNCHIDGYHTCDPLLCG